MFSRHSWEAGAFLKGNRRRVYLDERRSVCGGEVCGGAINKGKTADICTKNMI